MRESIERKDINAQANPRQQDGSCENYNDARTRLSLTRRTRLYNHGVDLPLIMARDRWPRYNKLPDLNFPLPSRRFLEPGVAKCGINTTMWEIMGLRGVSSTPWNEISNGCMREYHATGCALETYAIMNIRFSTWTVPFKFFAVRCWYVAR